MPTDYLMQDLTDARLDPAPVPPGTFVRKWSPSDYPFNKEQALLVLKHAADTGFFISRKMAEVIHACITSENGWVYHPLSPIQCQCGSSLHGWAYLTSNGWYGGYATEPDARDAYYNSRVGWAE